MGVADQGCYSEKDTADTIWQVLLAINYIHCHGIVHRDVKLENFLYDAKGSNHLKLIDFGFSKVWDINTKMQACVGTLAYVAPEVLEKSYTSQCDLWSIGVLTYILLSGGMPFEGTKDEQIKAIQNGSVTFDPEYWSNVSEQAQHFVRGLLQVDPARRLSAQQALQHPFLAERNRRPTGPDIDKGTVDALLKFGRVSHFRRKCLMMLAWSLSNKEHAMIRQHFLKIDVDRAGTLSMAELKHVLVDKFKIPDQEASEVFRAIDGNQDDEISYSEFLAAMCCSRIQVHSELLAGAFARFDADGSGFITADDLRTVLGENAKASEIEGWLAEADHDQDGKVSYAEFVAYLRGDSASEEDQTAALRIIDKETERSSTQPSWTNRLWGSLFPKSHSKL